MMSFIKRVSVKGFVFLPPFPATPWFAFASEASSRTCVTLGNWGLAIEIFSLTVGFWVCSPLPPLVLGEVGF